MVTALDQTGVISLTEDCQSRQESVHSSKVVVGRAVKSPCTYHRTPRSIGVSSTELPKIRKATRWHCAYIESTLGVNRRSLRLLFFAVELKIFPLWLFGPKEQDLVVPFWSTE